MSCQTTTVARSPRQAPRDYFQFFPGVVAAGGCIFSEGQFRFFLSASSVSLSPRIIIMVTYFRPRKQGRLFGSWSRFESIMKHESNKPKWSMNS